MSDCISEVFEVTLVEFVQEGCYSPSSNQWCFGFDLTLILYVAAALFL